MLDNKVQRLRSERVNFLQTVSEKTPNVFSSAKKHRLALAAVLGLLAGVVQESSDSESDDSICFACNAVLMILGYS
ncbi:hypothetical protein D3C80_2053020 [compost metagenome]